MTRAVDDYPRWIRELLRQLQLRTLFLLYGNIHDMLPYPSDPSGKEAWKVGSLREALFHALTTLQQPSYDVVAAYDFVDGLRFADWHQSEQRMASLFEEAAQQQRKASTTTDSRVHGEGSQPLGLCDHLDRFRRVLANPSRLVSIVVDHASQLASSRDHLNAEERANFVKMLKASRESQRIRKGEGEDKVSLLYNNLILICEKITDIPTWLYLNNPFARCIEIEKPSSTDRRRHFGTYSRQFDGGEILLASAKKDAQLLQRTTDAFVDFTEGMTNRDLIGLRNLSRNEGLPLVELGGEKARIRVKELVEEFKYGTRESKWDGIENKLATAEDFLKARVKGQDYAIQATLDVLIRASLGLSGAEHSSPSKPRGVLFFAGPTGVGKTELAKALAEHIFGTEDALTRFDMSEYGHDHSDQRLLGAPPGYVGYEEGGQLTDKLKKDPFRILLFDEIDKAHRAIFDKFLQILEDGRLTDGRGETVYFSECIIVFTSNQGVYEYDPGTGRRVPVMDPTSDGYDYAQVRERVLKAIERFFKVQLERPELLNRFGNNIVVFGFIQPHVMDQILDKMLDNVKRQVEERREVKLAVSPAVREFLLSRCRGNVEQGGRGVGNLVQTALLNPLSRVLFQRREQIQKGSSITVTRVLESSSSASVPFEVEVQIEAS